MFSFSSNLCFMCLKTYKNLTSVLIRDNEDIQKKLKYCLPEIVDSHLEISKWICNNCISKLDCFYQFKQWCLQNNTHLNNYLQTLTSAGEKFKHLSVKLTDIKHQNKQQEVSMNQTLPIIRSHDELQTEGKEANGICIKQEESIFTIEIKCADVLHVEKLDSIFDKGENIVVKEKCASEDKVNIEFVKNTTCNYETLPIVGSGEKEDITTCIKEETGIKRDDLLDNEGKDMIVKEECVTSEDTGDIEFYHEFVKSTKCESISSDSDISISDTEDLDEATIKKKAEKTFQCAICNKVYPYKGSLKHHLKIHAGIKDFSCSTCDKKFMTKHNLIEHERSHIGIKNFKCAVCNKMFMSKSSLVKHLILHTGIKQHECSICNKKFAQRSALTDHKKIHTGKKSFECTICKKMFLRKTELRRHEEDHTGIRNFKCSTCSKEFKRIEHLKSHEISHKGVKNFECNICNKKFIHQRTLSQHVKTHTGIKNYECKQCDKKFMHKFQLIDHEEIIHSGVKNYECLTCKQTFFRKGSLIVHQKKHSGVKNYQCSTCNKKFLYKGSLARHVLIHTGTKMFECPICNKMFLQNCTLTRHKQNVHCLNEAESQYLKR